MTEALALALINGAFQLFQAGVERSAIIDRLQGVPPEKYPDILDAMMAEAKAARDAAIGAAPE
jgi:hypothetical protein